jgi:hypothetical protein
MTAPMRAGFEVGHVRICVRRDLAGEPFEVEFRNKEDEYITLALLDDRAQLFEFLAGVFIE